MPRHSSPRRSSRYLLAAIALLLVAGACLAGPASAHTFTRNDANDSASKIDLRSVSVSHTSTSVVHSVRTWNSWTPASLQHDSFFLIGINKDNDAAYERCAFIYYTNRLRGQLSNCGSQFIRYLTVSKVNPTTAKITIPKSQVGAVYEWYGGEFLGRGERRVVNVCRDFAPNTLPDILHDLKPPVATLEATTDVRVWEDLDLDDLLLPVLRLRCAQRGRFVESATASVRDVVERRLGLGRRVVQIRTSMERRGRRILLSGLERSTNRGTSTISLLTTGPRPARRRQSGRRWDLQRSRLHMPDATAFGGSYHGVRSR